MKYKAYPEYKDSGVEWLGDIPVDWRARQLKFLCTYNDEVLTDSVLDDYEIEYVDIGSVSATEGILRTESMSIDNAPSRAKRIVRDGDVIISTVRTYLEAIAPIDNPPNNLIVSTGFAVIRPNRWLHKGYAAYCLRASGFIKEVVAQSVGVSYPAINASDLVNIKTPEPKYEEQKQIANFLDHETAKIDTLIEKQQQLIKLLKEKRQAVISHAVTKGLNPNAPMKDSSIEWLGEIPAHWEVKKLKHVIKHLESGVSVNAADVPAQNNEFGILKTSCVYTRTFRVNENKTVVPSEYDRVKCPIREGAIIISRMNTPELVGASALVNSNDPNIFLPDRLWQTVFNDKGLINPKFIAYFMMIKGFRNQISLAAEGASSSMQNIAKEDYLSINITFPKIEEQCEVANFIETKISKLDKLILKAEQAIELIKERRTALISAAVTGKIDVRGFSLQPENTGGHQ